MERPGQPEFRKFFPADPAVTGERRVENDRLEAVDWVFGQIVTAQAGANTLSEPEGGNALALAALLKPAGGTGYIVEYVG